ncbi:MAG: sigma-70 family RNA polymerase sigma factor [Gemmataceae bacterium]|nr:sigma-70 family RNA polymerase sigma factor [Gemmataceae bacterium]
MDLADHDERLSQITTLWPLLRQAHGGQADLARLAQQELIQRYCGAVYRYLLGAVHDEEAALELFQEFALRFVRGDFRRADPQRGRFRDYVKAVLINLVNDYRAAARDRPLPLPADHPAPPDPKGPEVRFVASWREELLTRVWAALAELRPTLFAVLLLHVRRPDLTSAQMTEHLTAELGRPFTPTRVRVTLHRARERFADLLLDEVAHSLEAPTEAELCEELRALDLLTLCRPALHRRGYAC